MIELATLILAAAALAVALAAIRKSSDGAKGRSEARDQGIRQELSDLRQVMESLPGRIADETAASPLREAVEGVRESISQAGQTMEEHVQRVGLGFASSTQAVESSLDRGFKGIADRLDALRASSEAGSKALASMDPSSGMKPLEASLREVLRAIQEGSAVREKSFEAGLHKIELSLLPVVDSLGRLAGRVDSLPEALEAQFARVESATRAVSGGLTEIVEATRSLADSQLNSQGSEPVVAAVSAIEQELSNLSKELGSSIAALPLKIAEASANHARPVPELEELAIAVRESGHMRGDASRSVADAVSRVSQELSDSARESSEARNQTAASLQGAMDSLEAFVSRLETRLAPLSDALKGHGDAVAPMAQGLNQAQDRLEEAASSLRANQVEFAASVAVFTQAAQELSGGLSLFAHEGEKQGSEDPRAAQKALLESLDRLMGGFAESLKSLLTESDLRTREVLAEIAARLPAGEGA
jgi:exonuclease VII small subunit